MASTGWWDSSGSFLCTMWLIIQFCSVFTLSVLDNWNKNTNIKDKSLYLFFLLILSTYNMIRFNILVKIKNYFHMSTDVWIVGFVWFFVEHLLTPAWRCLGLTCCAGHHGDIYHKLSCWAAAAAVPVSRVVLRGVRGRSTAEARTRVSPASPELGGSRSAYPEQASGGAVPCNARIISPWPAASVTCDATSGPCQHVTRDTALHNYKGMHTLNIILIRPKCSVFTQINTFHGLFFLKLFDSFELLEIFFRHGYQCVDI